MTATTLLTVEQVAIDQLRPDPANPRRIGEIIAEMTVRLAELDGVPPGVPLDSETVSLRTAQLVADLVEPAKAETLDKLGEGRQALDIAAGWVRAKLDQVPKGPSS